MNLTTIVVATTYGIGIIITLIGVILYARKINEYNNNPNHFNCNKKEDFDIKIICK